MTSDIFQHLLCGDSMLQHHFKPRIPTQTSFSLPQNSSLFFTDWFRKRCLYSAGSKPESPQILSPLLQHLFAKVLLFKIIWGEEAGICDFSLFLFS